MRRAIIVETVDLPPELSSDAYLNVLVGLELSKRLNIPMDLGYSSSLRY
jgi:hypothetical protein